MYGHKTLESLNRALYAAGLGRFAYTEEEWLFGCDNRKAYTMASINVEKALQQHKIEEKAWEKAKINRPRLSAANYR